MFHAIWAHTEEHDKPRCIILTTNITSLIRRKTETDASRSAFYGPWTLAAPLPTL